MKLLIAYIFYNSLYVRFRKISRLGRHSRGGYASLVPQSVLNDEAAERFKRVMDSNIMKPSKFQVRLDEAMKEGEKARKKNK